MDTGTLKVNKSVYWYGCGPGVIAEHVRDSWLDSQH